MENPVTVEDVVARREQRALGRFLAGKWTRIAEAHDTPAINTLLEQGIATETSWMGDPDGGVGVPLIRLVRPTA